MRPATASASASLGNFAQLGYRNEFHARRRRLRRKQFTLTHAFPVDGRKVISFGEIRYRLPNRLGRCLKLVPRLAFLGSAERFGHDTQERDGSWTAMKGSTGFEVVVVDEHTVFGIASPQTA